MIIKLLKSSIPSSSDFYMIFLTTKQLLLMRIFVFSNKNMSKKSFKAPPSVGFLMGLYGLPQLGLKGKPLVSPLYL